MSKNEKNTLENDEKIDCEGLKDLQSFDMATKYILSASLGTCAVAWIWSTPGTVSNKEWWEETDKKFQAWPRTAGPPVVMNPISRQNFIVKTSTDS
ncbi:hypothetical protein G4B88_008006 [Cannabis sativa]|uniref:Uncharacterized protein n=2 Tax=Cannabis sativa TaxID=3483 RepID=A0A7J6I9L0_CANSA|nr:hypothetical protein G4B88_008006 [Cannabis sativa]